MPLDTPALEGRDTTTPWVRILERLWTRAVIRSELLVRVELTTALDLPASTHPASQGPASTAWAAWLEHWQRADPIAPPMEWCDWTQVPTRTAAILREALRIPFGHTRTYGHLATACGIPKGARAIGQAMRRNPFPLLVPCHRVLQGDGRLGGYSAGGPAVKSLLLQHERSDFSGGPGPGSG